LYFEVLKEEQKKIIFIIEDLHINEDSTSLKLIEYIDYIIKQRNFKNLSLVEINDQNKMRDLIYQSRNLYYGIFYHYSFLGEKRNLQTVFEVFDNYFLKKFHENYHSQLLKNLSKLLLNEISVNYHYLLKFIVNSLQNAYILLPKSKNQYIII